MRRASVSIISLIAASMTLSACGGGSTSGGSGPGTTPPPPTTPTTPPPPTIANADLINLTKSEDFTNDAATGTASYSSTSGNFISASAAASALKVVYHQDTKTYSITGARARNFSPANLNSSKSNSNIAVYETTNGNTTDTLTLTKPGNSGLKYQYVGAGFWQRTVKDTSTISGSFDAFTYGVETPDSALPRTGGSVYDANLLGVVARNTGLNALSGDGQVQINFLSGGIVGNGSMRETFTDGSGFFTSSNWFYNGTLSATQNKFSGNVTIDAASTAALTGIGQGRLYGPNAQEIGLAFNATNSAGEAAVGTIIGRQSATEFIGKNSSLTNLQFSEDFARSTMGYRTQTIPNTSTAVETWQTSWQEQIGYRSSNNSYVVLQAGAPLGGSFGSSDINSSKTNNRYVTYEKQDGAKQYSLVIYRPGSGNDELALTYASFAHFTQTTPPEGVVQNTQNYSSYIAFGTQTPEANIPKSGTANYTGIMKGEAYQSAAGLPTHSVNGTAVLIYDFAARGSSFDSFTATLNPVLTNLTSGATNSLAPITFDSNQFLSFGPILFAGPNAEEAAASFRTLYASPNQLFYDSYMQGVVLTKRQ